MKRNNESLKVILLTVLTAAGFAGGALAAEGRKLLWSDEFNGPQLDTNIWRRIDRGTSDWNRHMSTRADLLEMRDGCVVLVVKSTCPRFPCECGSTGCAFTSNATDEFLPEKSSAHF